MNKKVNRELICKLYSNGESTHTIAKRFDVYHSTILWHMKKLNIQLRSKSEANKLAFKLGRIKIRKHIIPDSSQNLTKERAYILGVLCGDGYISFYPKISTYQICLQTIDKEFADKFSTCLQKIYLIKPYRKYIVIKNPHWKNKYEVRLCSKEACNDILNIDDFKTKTWFVPQLIKNSQPEIQVEFLKGFFDSEGSIEKDGRRISGTSSNLNGLKEIQKILYQLGINSKISKNNKAFNLRIQDKKSIEKYKQKIGFIIKRKTLRC